MRRIGLVLLAATALAACALLAAGGSLSGPPRWTPDGLFYQARVLELGGADRDAALTRTFGGPMGRELRALDPERSGDPAWVRYNARFYERRLLVPLAASALEPVAGERAILDLSVAGYVAAVLAVFALLLLRFSLPLATAVGAATAFLPALTFHSSFPLTDSWGLALQSAALACAVLVVRGRRYALVGWAIAVLMLSITRDSVWIPLLAAAFLALRYRSRVSARLLVCGVAMALPAMLAFRVPMRELLAQMLNGLQPAPDLSWGAIAGRWPGAVVDLLQADGGYVRDGAWYSAAFLAGGVVLLFVLSRGRPDDRAATLMKAAAAAAAAYVLVVPIFSAFRLDLVLVPMAAWGIGLGAERLAARFALPARVRLRPALGAPGRAD